MGIEKAIQILKGWVKADRNIREHDKGKEFHELDDYSQFCEERNMAIEKVLDEIEELRELIVSRVTK